MKNLLIFLFFTPLFLHAEEPDFEKRMAQIYRTSSKMDNQLGAGDCLYEFEFNSRNNYWPAPTSVKFSIDGKNGEQQLENKTITIKATPGKHIFQFFYNEHYYEVYSDSLAIKSQYRDRYMVNLYEAEREVMEEKPVIYLYPQQATDVTVKMDIHGENAFLYPTYTDSWKFTAHPNGDLVFGKNTYNYLFWEATQRTIISPKQTASGFFVEGKNAVQFLEDKLTKAGLNSKEQADFITYWGPRLAKNKLNFVHFEFNETCEKYAELNISPKPDNLYRIYIVWGAVSEEFEVKEQEIEAFERSGFSVLEWGGQESKITQSFLVK